MKTILTLFLTLTLFQNCTSQKGTLQAQKKFPIVMKEVNQQNWVAGIRGGGSGTNVTILFSKEVPSTIILRQLFYQNTRVEALKISSTEFQFLFRGKANWQRNDEEIVDGDNNGTSEAVIIPPITIGENEALLEYLDKGKKKYYKITNIVQKEPLAYP